jgi:hypothetical protein
VQSWLGHRSIQSTMIYLRVVDIRIKEAAEKLANWAIDSNAHGVPVNSPAGIDH